MPATASIFSSCSGSCMYSLVTFFIRSSFSGSVTSIGNSSGLPKTGLNRKYPVFDIDPRPTTAGFPRISSRMWWICSPSVALPTIWPIMASHPNRDEELFCSMKPPVPTETTNSIGTSGKSVRASWIATAAGLLATIPPVDKRKITC